jgi:hypothetical protein
MPVYGAAKLGKRLKTTGVATAELGKATLCRNSKRDPEGLMNDVKRTGHSSFAVIKQVYSASINSLPAKTAALQMACHCQLR